MRALSPRRIAGHTYCKPPRLPVVSLGVETDAPNVRIIVYPRDPDQRGERTRAGWGRDLPLARATQPRSDAVMYAGEIYDRTVPRRTTGPRHRDRDAVHRVRLAAPHGCTATLLHLQYLQLCTYGCGRTCVRILQTLGACKTVPPKRDSVHASLRTARPVPRGPALLAAPPTSPPSEACRRGACLALAAIACVQL